MISGPWETRDRFFDVSNTAMAEKVFPRITIAVKRGASRNLPAMRTVASLVFLG
ncbi:hypothetical protein CULT_100066 [[Clostridium] ultunense Esp]|nr:hypothetical protein CULT_100066 [[Clostridium] ultunense Esp]